MGECSGITVCLVGLSTLKTSGQTDRQRPTDRPTDEANSACPSDESTNHLQKHFYAIIPAARRGGRSSVDRQSFYYNETRIYAIIKFFSAVRSTFYSSPIICCDI